jgi:DNA repair ATPase RecN
MARHDLYPTTFNPHGDRSFVEAFSLVKWGIFDKATVDLGQFPCFTVITGETASGKSVILTALRSICSGTSLNSSLGRKLSHKGQVGDIRTGSSLAQSDSELILKTTSGKTYKRYFDRTASKFLCEIDGSKSSVKSVSESLKGSVRFWGPEDIQCLGAGSDGFIQYVDMNLGDDGRDVLKSVDHTFSSWSSTHEQLKRLTKLERRMKGGEEVEMLTYYLSELAAFQTTVRKVLMAVLETASEIHEALLMFRTSEGHSNTSDGIAGTDIDDVDEDIDVDRTAEDVSEISHLMAAVSDILAISKEPANTRGQALSSKKKSMSSRQESMVASANIAQLDLVKCRTAFSMAMKLFSGIDREMKAVFPSTTATATTGKHAGHRGMAATAATAAASVENVDEILEDYCDRMLDLQQSFRGIGCTSAAFEREMERAQLSLQEAMNSIKDARNVMSTIQRSIPDTSEILEQLQKVTVEWDSLSRKHNIKPSELQILQQRWRQDLGSMVNLAAELPALRKLEESKRKEYTALAFQLTALRVRAAASLMDRVNKILPSLEIRDKILCAEVTVDLMRFFDDDIDDDINGMNFNFNFNYASSPENNEQQQQISESSSSKHSKSVSHLTEKWKHSVFWAATDTTALSAAAIEELKSGPKNFKGLTVEDEGELLNILSERLLPTGGVTRSGWDEIAIKVMRHDSREEKSASLPSPLLAETDHDGSSNREGGQKAGSKIDGVVVRIKLHEKDARRKGEEEYTSDEEELSEVSYYSDDIRSIADDSDYEDYDEYLPVDILSSGEKTRLALALETSTVRGGAFDNPGISNARSDSPNNVESSPAHLINGELSDETAKRKDRKSTPATATGNAGGHLGGESLLVLDEIDAHVGGEAAVAIARLLRSQGKWRQVLAVTHNPVIAAAADRHYVVTKSISSSSSRARSQDNENSENSHDYELSSTTGEDANVGAYQQRSAVSGTAKTTYTTTATTLTPQESSSVSSRNSKTPSTAVVPPLRSSLAEVAGETRVQELARMATGKLDTDAGQTLARALLSANYD